MRFRSFTIILLLLCGLLSCSTQEAKQPPIVPETKALFDRLNDKTTPTEEKQELLGNLLEMVNGMPNDSVKLDNLIKIYKQYLKLNDTTEFKVYNKRVRTLSKRMNDSTHLARSSWDLAHFYYSKTAHIDSAYLYFNEAYKINMAMADYGNAARLLINVSTIQHHIKDYLGSEASAYRAIELLEAHDRDNFQLYRAYNNIGVSLKELQDFEKSLSFFERAEQLLNEKVPTSQSVLLWNNMGTIYSILKKYSKAQTLFNKALEQTPNLKSADPQLYVVILTNLAQNEMTLGDTIRVRRYLNEAMATALENNHQNGITLVHINLATLCLFANDTLGALNHTLQAHNTALKQQDNRALLHTLTNLIQVDRANAAQHALAYITLNDSLQQRERLTQNRFAAIRYETDVYIEKSKRLSNRLTWVWAIGSGIVISLILLFIIFRERSRNKELMLIQEKNEADQQIYKLVMKQQQKYDEGRRIEKVRIARELHDGILGKLFGLQLNLEMLNATNDEDSQEKRYAYIDQLRDVSQEIRSLSHDLNKDNTGLSDFTSIVRDYVEKQNTDTTQFDLHIDKNITFENMSGDVKVNLFRIIQEAIQNIHKHAQASKAWINITKVEQFIELCIEDNGKWSDGKRVKNGIGLNNMKSRAKEMNGVISIQLNLGGEVNSRIILKFPHP